MCDRELKRLLFFRDPVPWSESMRCDQKPPRFFTDGNAGGFGGGFAFRSLAFSSKGFAGTILTHGVCS